MVDHPPRHYRRCVLPLQRFAPVARAWFAVTAAVVVAALAVQIPITAGAEGGRFATAAERVANLFAFFTIQSNVLVGVTCVLLALDPHRRSALFRTLRLCALLGITVTALVYHAVLADLTVLVGAEWYADQLFHSVTPLLAVAGWVLFGPRGMVDGRVVLWSLAFPVTWLVFTLARGGIIDWYPYPFTDVTALGYGAVALNCLLVALLFLGLAAGLLVLDRLLGRLGRAAVVTPVTGSDA
jgi:hypothetical protein